MVAGLSLAVYLPALAPFAQFYILCLPRQTATISPSRRYWPSTAVYACREATGEQPRVRENTVNPVSRVLTVETCDGSGISFLEWY